MSLVKRFPRVAAVLLVGILTASALAPAVLGQVAPARSEPATFADLACPGKLIRSSAPSSSSAPTSQTAASSPSASSSAS
jgi:hypothetical protein